MDQRFLVVGLNPTLQNTFFFPAVRLGQVNRAVRRRLDVAGKGINTARILTQLGEQALHLSQAGGRHLGVYRELCREDGVVIRYADCGGDIRHCHTLIDEGARTATEIVEAGAPVTAETERCVLALYGDLLPTAHTVVICGSRAPGFSPGLYPAMVRLAADADTRTVLDVRGEDLLGCIPFRPTVVKINVSEFSHTFDPDCALPEDVRPDSIPDRLYERMVSLRSEHGVEVVLTNGGNPVLFVRDGQVRSLTPEPVAPVNAIGSGDAVTAGLAAGLHRGAPLEEAVLLGMECARKNVQHEKPGTIR